MQTTTKKLGWFGLILCGALAGPAAQAGEKVWISVGDAALQILQRQGAVTETRSSVQAAARLKTGGERIHLVQVDEGQLTALSEAVHHELKRCGGYMFHSSQAEGLALLQRQADSGLRQRLAVATATRPSYVIDQQTAVNPLLGQMQSSHIGQTIVDLSGFTNRYYQTTAGVQASDWLKQRWTTLAAGRSDITVEQYTHAGWKQKSVIATIQGTDNAAEVVVLGGHLDSTLSSGVSETSRAPGADDDASGVASVTEVLRVLAASGYKPRRTLKFMAYAAEEVGLRGSAEIAKAHATAGINVVGVMQLDMTNYKGSANDIYIYTDYTDSTQNGFVTNLITSYLPTLKVGTDRCGYGCSDHASWTAQGYVASFPFEATFSGSNPHIHTANDTFANSGNQAEHALKFAKLALAYAVELGSDGPGVPPPTDKTETFSGSLTRGQTRSFGPFKVAGGGSFKASTTGTGDIDLYARAGSVPTTSRYGCKSDGGTATESCTLSFSANGDAYVLLKGYTAGSYQLTVVYRPQ
ncbi:leucyl aminopeptidase [Inhella inkyongensis]|uniref:Leucyl aminopeptidase n=1 Tax=Inhella inkyongensis TaxID=392593 RepID=A0A840S212_9BURK|nr:M20/M25/M40 family metallo-hydrolase [Inhella inkyongensis]MBB5203126.1 leucyl aminopeptidase [Inhella inkyongensis]